MIDNKKEVLRTGEGSSGIPQGVKYPHAKKDSDPSMVLETLGRVPGKPD